MAKKNLAVNALRYVAFQCSAASDSGDIQDVCQQLVPQLMKRLELQPMDILEADSFEITTLQRPRTNGTALAPQLHKLNETEGA